MAPLKTGGAVETGATTGNPQPPVARIFVGKRQVVR